MPLNTLASGMTSSIASQRPSTPDGQVERMNRTIKEATVKRYHYETHDNDFVAAYNFGRRLKTLKGLPTLRVHLQTMDGRA
ncbi:hypothetical protein BQ8482_530029 [Mesorhizobium delmotii]|uniref:Integrase catalytic domain-containing protein n=1 Tax=Mesorhizobium delmotii TaxID=1631247 RepID=A0A2P9AUJ8_9HYPH|nr:hypothetical protein BQ8482_530029 [Mesorhizobium delmotii]